MKKTFEPIDSVNFKPLSPQKLQKVLGGTTTGADKERIGAESRTVQDPDNPGRTILQYRSVYKCWTSDERDGNDMCFYGTVVCYGEWQ